MMGEKLFKAVGSLAMMVIALVLIVMLIVVIVSCVGGTFIATAVLDALYEITELAPMPY